MLQDGDPLILFLRLMAPIFFLVLLTPCSFIMNGRITGRLFGSAGKMYGVFDIFAGSKWLKISSKNYYTPGENFSLYRTIGYSLLLPVISLPLLAIPICEPIMLSSGLLHAELFVSEFAILLVIGLLLVSSGYRLLLSFSSFGDQRGEKMVESVTWLASCMVILVITVLAVVVSFNSFSLYAIVQEQTHVISNGIPFWGTLRHPLGALLFFTMLLVQYDTTTFFSSGSNSSSAESILMKIGCEVELIVMSAFFVTLFAGGHALLPGMAFITSKLVWLYYPFQLASLLFKTLLVVVMIHSIRIFFIRVRTQARLLEFWRYLIPAAFLNVILVVAVEYFRNRGIL